MDIITQDKQFHTSVKDVRGVHVVNEMELLGNERPEPPLLLLLYMNRKFECLTVKSWIKYMYKTVVCIEKVLVLLCIRSKVVCIETYL